MSSQGRMTKSHSNKSLENIKENLKSHRYRPSDEDSDSGGQLEVSRRARRSRGKHKVRIAMSDATEDENFTRNLHSTNVKPLDNVSRQKSVKTPREEPISITGVNSFKNEAPIKDHDQVNNIVDKALKTPLCLSTEDLLAVSKEFRNELENLVNRKMIANDLGNLNLNDLAITFTFDENNDCNEFSNETIMISDPPQSSFKLSSEVVTENLPTGSISCEDPVIQCFVGVTPGEENQQVVIAGRDLQPLETIYPLFNVEGQDQSVLNRGTQVVLTGKDAEEELRIPWDPDIRVHRKNTDTWIEKTSRLPAKRSWAECLMQSKKALSKMIAMEDRLSRSLAQVAVRGAHFLPMLGALFLRH